ncbi:deoxyribose-phosphate aldolase [Trichocladium antarcticum]|uniref:Deoxyribose-phosphate aldolase n=1 Tax=Trichocladium antarcticum TaxID=1450529 RepID=A0AAN6UH99_9PEZI|nr:deoxyribose-phosphate aldolase [Trichocladium antarcticum]
MTSWPGDRAAIGPPENSPAPTPQGPNLHTMTEPTTASITVSLGDIAQRIDHALLHPAMTDAEVAAGLQIAREHGVAATCIKPYSTTAAREALAGSGVLVCAVVGFPHGSSTTRSKVAEAEEAMQAGAYEIDMVVNVGKVLGGDWDYVRDEIRAVGNAVAGIPAGGGRDGEPGALKVIFENDYLADEHVVRLCRICTELGVAFVKTSTGYGFVKQGNGIVTGLAVTYGRMAIAGRMAIVERLCDVGPAEPVAYVEPAAGHIPGGLHLLS